MSKLFKRSGTKPEQFQFHISDFELTTKSSDAEQKFQIVLTRGDKVTKSLLKAPEAHDDPGFSIIDWPANRYSPLSITATLYHKGNSNVYLKKVAKLLIKVYIKDAKGKVPSEGSPFGTLELDLAMYTQPGACTYNIDARLADCQDHNVSTPPLSFFIKASLHK